MSYKSLPSGISAGGGDSTSNNPRLSSFISAHPAVAGLSSPSSAEDLAKMAVSNPKVLKYPLAVNWDEGEVSIGSVDGVKEIIENMRKRRDSEMSSSSDTPMKPKGWWF
ncbi:hypothetical protein FRC02_005778 [Tulasnella sp. 418]|nr:hypothetical protein FRC02_005778 [Tulasnella sp. 418]